MTDHDAWPPEQPKQFTTLALVHHKNQPTEKQIIAMANATIAGDVTSIIAAATTNGQVEYNRSDSLKEVLKESKATNSLSDILAPLENPESEQLRTILIEGATGLGKTVLMKQIAYQWACGELLRTSHLVFLLYLRDPVVREMSSINDLVQYFYPEEKIAMEQADVCANYLCLSNGQNITFLLDGFDEFPEVLRKDSFIADIIQHRQLSLASVVVSSRSHACARLRDNVSCRVDILGFTKEDQLDYIQKALPGKPEKVKELVKYCDEHSMIGSLCFIPFNLTVLMYLFKRGIKLPSSCTEIYKYFICHTICHFLVKSKENLQDNIDLDNLPQPISEVIQQLSSLCLQALDKNQFVFTLNEVKVACPGFTTIPGAINAFGLMQAVEHFTYMGTTLTLNFIHCSIQEFLAAYRISCLSPDEEKQLIVSKFWSPLYRNTFSMYVGLTKGQRCSFKDFLFDGCQKNEIADRFFEDEMTCLWLFKCFYEANDKYTYDQIAKRLFSDGNIVLTKGFNHTTPLLLRDLLCLSFFLCKSRRKQWQQLNLAYCHITDAGLRILHQLSVGKGIIFEDINLMCNSLTSLSASAICDIVRSCKTNSLNISDNRLGDVDWVEHLLQVTLKKLYIRNTGLSSGGAVALFSAIRKNDNSHLECLDISDNPICDKAVEEITVYLQETSTLRHLDMNGLLISGDAIQTVVDTVFNNQTLNVLGLSYSYPFEVKTRTQALIEEKRKVNSSQQELRIVFQ
ncbi:NACHT, LRR and PYD domains-containing protein 3-like isoform X2 [Dysidea avara]